MNTLWDFSHYFERTTETKEEEAWIRVHTRRKHSVNTLDYARIRGPTRGSTVRAAIEQLSYRMIDDSIVRAFPCPCYDFVRAAYKKPAAISKMAGIMENSSRKIDRPMAFAPRDFTPSCNPIFAALNSRFSYNSSASMTVPGIVSTSASTFEHGKEDIANARTREKNCATNLKSTVIWDSG